jgi:hypothetical protein
MAISNVSINPPANTFVSPVANNAAVPAPDRVQPSANQQASATVTLSTQGQKQSQTSQAQSSQSQANLAQTSNSVNTPVNPNVVPQSKETNAAPGIQFMTGESKGGRVNIYA